VSYLEETLPKKQCICDENSCTYFYNNKHISCLEILSPAYGAWVKSGYDYMLKCLLAMIFPSVLASSIFVLLFRFFCMSHAEPPLSTLCA